MGAAVLGNLGHSVLEWPTGVTVHKPEKCANGYTLFSLFFSPVVYLIDMAGRVVHLWGVGTGQVEPGTSRMTYHAKYIGDGRVLMSVSHRPIAPPDQGLREVDWDGNILREYGEYPLKWHHHDFQRGYVNRCVNDIRRRPSQPLLQWRFHPHTVHRGRRLRSTQGPSDA